MDHHVSATRLRIGLTVWLISWLPFPLLLLAIAHSNGNYTSAQQSSAFLATCYAVQYAIGFIGLLVAGSEAIKLVKSGGWRGLPKRLWRVIRHGKLS